MLSAKRGTVALLAFTALGALGILFSGAVRAAEGGQSGGAAALEAASPYEAEALEAAASGAISASEAAAAAAVLGTAEEPFVVPEYNGAPIPDSALAEGPAAEPEEPPSAGIAVAAPDDAATGENPAPAQPPRKVFVVDTVRASPGEELRDVWASNDVRFSKAVLKGIFRAAGLEMTATPALFCEHGVPTNAEVVCSAFRTQAMLDYFDFPLQPVCQMHYALYATAEKAQEMTHEKIMEWPSLRVAYSPVSQGDTDDREKFFKYAKLEPEYICYPTSAGAVEALRRGEADVLFLYTPFGKRPEGLVEIVPMGDRNVYFAVRKDRPDLFKLMTSTYRKRYIEAIDRYDELREELLGIPRPKKRVRVAAYSRGDLFQVTPDGERSGTVEEWLMALSGQARWEIDYVYGDYEESLDAVLSGKLDLIGGLGYSAVRRGMTLLYPHTPIGVLRVYLWARNGSHFRPGNPKTWNGMKVGLLAGTHSAELAKRYISLSDYGMTYKEYREDHELEAAFERGEINACVDVEKPSLENAVALHVYVSHPMYICVAQSRMDLFGELETALDELCDDFSRYMRMITEHRYGFHSSLADLSLVEAEWLRARVAKNRTVYIDLSPWPYAVQDSHGDLTGFPGMLFREISRRTGLRFKAMPGKELQSAEAQFLRGETEFWIPYPARPKYLVNGTTSVFELIVPQEYAELVGAQEANEEFELLASPGTPRELVSILRKTVAGIESDRLQAMFMKAVAEHDIESRFFGMTPDELKRLFRNVGISLLLIIVLYGILMIRLYRRQAKKAELAAADAERHATAKTRFLAAMSHELRTPLNAVIGFAEFLSEGEKASEKHPEYVDGILTSANALLELINDILDFSKLEAGGEDLHADRCDVERIMEDLKTIFGFRVQKRGVKLVVKRKGAEKIPELMFSRQALRQVLINIVGNAAKFTSQGYIAVVYSWGKDDKTLKIDISDTGVGISDAKMKRLFDPFVQDIANRMDDEQTGQKGTGLGLPIVKRIIDQAGGTIDVKSALGQGTRFKITIPGLEEALPEEMAEEESGASAGGILAKLTGPLKGEITSALVVDDTPLNRKVLGIHLEKLGIKEIRYAENGIKAMDVMKDWRPDVVFTDMWMPEMDGASLAFVMSTSRTLSSVPVVAVTADVDAGATYDMTHFAKIISKPVTREKLSALFEKKGGEG